MPEVALPMAYPMREGDGLGDRAGRFDERNLLASQNVLKSPQHDLGGLRGNKLVMGDCRAELLFERSEAEDLKT